MKKISALLLCFAFVFGSCKKEKSPDTTTISAENLSGTYTYTKVTLKTGNGPEQDITSAAFETCEKDNLVVLAKNGTYSISDIGVVCTPSAAESGNWSLNGTTTITVGSDTFTIASFDGKVLVLSESYTDSGVTFVSTFTITKQ